MTIDVQNCRNIFLVKIPNKIGVAGHIAVVFGNRELAIIHIDPVFENSGFEISY